MALSRYSLIGDLLLVIITISMVIIPALTGGPKFSEEAGMERTQTVVEMALCMWLVISFLPRLAEKCKWNKVKEIVSSLLPLLIMVVALAYFGQIDPEKDFTILKYFVWFYLIFLLVVKVLFKKWFAQKFGQDANANVKDGDEDENISES